MEALGAGSTSRLAPVVLSGSWAFSEQQQAQCLEVLLCMPRLYARKGLRSTGVSGVQGLLDAGFTIC